MWISSAIPLCPERDDEPYVKGYQLGSQSREADGCIPTDGEVEL
jgi:hypothetical protein